MTTFKKNNLELIKKKYQLKGESFLTLAFIIKIQVSVAGYAAKNKASWFK